MTLVSSLKATDICRWWFHGLLFRPDLQITEYSTKDGFHLWTDKPTEPLKMNFRIEKRALIVFPP